MKRISIIILSGLLCSLLAQCSSSDDNDGGCFSCLAESRRTGCGGAGFTEWEETSITIEEPRDGLNPEEFCKDTFPAGGETNCSATCCIEIQYRNIRVGSCR